MLWRKLLFAVLIVAIGSCASACAGRTAQSLRLTVDQYPRVDGSTATIPLSEAVAARVLGMEPAEARQYIKHNTTHPAYVNLIEGRADVIFVTAPSEGERALAAAKGVSLEVIPLVNEGFVFFVNAKNPVQSLTLDQIRDIYAGRVTNWAAVGGPDKRIAAYQRPENSGSQTGMLDLVIDEAELMPAPTEKVIAEMGQIIDAVAVYSNEEDAIGYSYYFFATDMWNNEKIRLLAVNGVKPSRTTIGDRTYPIMTAYYAVLRSSEPAGSNARKLVDWALSEQGQRAIEEAGYVRLRTK